MNLLLSIFLDECGGTLAITRKTANTLITAAGFNTNYAEIEAIVNGDIDGTNLEDAAVTAAKLNADVVRAGYGLVQHTTGALQVDVSDTNPGLEISDGGVRVKVDDSSIERASGGIQVKALGITNAMLYGSIPASKLSDTYLTNTLHDVVARHPLTVGGTGATSASGAFTNIVVPKVYVSDWTAFVGSTAYTFPHGLNTTKVLVFIEAAENSDGSGWFTTIPQVTPASTDGCAVYALTTTQISIRIQPHISVIPADGTPILETSGYIRVLMLALE